MVNVQLVIAGEYGFSSWQKLTGFFFASAEAAIVGGGVSRHDGQTFTRGITVDGEWPGR